MVEWLHRVLSPRKARAAVVLWYTILVLLVVLSAYHANGDFMYGHI